MDRIITAHKLDLENLTAKLRQMEAEKISIQMEQHHVTSEQRNVVQSLQQVIGHYSLTGSGY